MCTVKQLIEKLQEYPEDGEVMVLGADPKYWDNTIYLNLDLADDVLFNPCFNETQNVLYIGGD
jgi:hypothetical protein